MSEPEVPLVLSRIIIAKTSRSVVVAKISIVKLTCLTTVLTQLTFPMDALDQGRFIFDEFQFELLFIRNYISASFSSRAKFRGKKFHCFFRNFKIDCVVSIQNSISFNVLSSKLNSTFLIMFLLELLQ